MKTDRSYRETPEKSKRKKHGRLHGGTIRRGFSTGIRFILLLVISVSILLTLLTLLTTSFKDLYGLVDPQIREVDE